MEQNITELVNTSDYVKYERSIWRRPENIPNKYLDSKYDNRGWGRNTLLIPVPVGYYSVWHLIDCMFQSQD